MDLDLTQDPKGKEGLKRAILERGIVFEEVVEKGLSQAFPGAGISTNICFRDKSLAEDYNDRYEVDFLLKKNNLHFLIEAKSSSYDWLFFDAENARKNFSILQIDLNQKKFLHVMSKEDVRNMENMPIVKRGLQTRTKEKKILLGNGGKIQSPDKDLIRESVRQISRNCQVYIDQFNEEGQVFSVIPIIVTSSPLYVFSNLFSSEQEELSLETYRKKDFICFEYDDFFFQNGEKIDSYKRNGEATFKCEGLESKFHVFIVSKGSLEKFINRF